MRTSPRNAHGHPRTDTRSHTLARKRARTRAHSHTRILARGCPAWHTQVYYDNGMRAYLDGASVVINHIDKEVLGTLNPKP